MPAARSTQTIYGYRRCRVSGRGGENPSRDGKLQGKLLKTRDAGKRLKADGERVGKTEWENQCRNDRFASNQQGQHSRWMMKGVTETCFRHPHLRPITVQTRRIYNANTAILQCKHGDFARQTRRICLSNTANLLAKHGEIASPLLSKRSPAFRQSVDKACKMTNLSMPASGCKQPPGERVAKSRWKNRCRKDRFGYNVRFQVKYV